MLGGTLSDENQFIDNVDGTDDLVTTLDTEITNFNNLVSGGTVPAGSSVPVVNSIDAVDNKLLDLSDSPVALDGGLGIIVAIPSEKFGMAFTASGRGYGAASFLYEDGQTVTNFTADITNLDGCYNGSDISDPLVISCITTTPFNYVDTNPASPTFGEVLFDSDADLQSKLRTLGVVQAEIGLSFSREFFILGQNIAIGLTPKMVSTSVIDYTTSAQGYDSNDDDIDDFTEGYFLGAS